MHGALDISWTNLLLGYVLVLVPVTIFGYYRTGLVKDTIIAVIRMTIQLLLVGIYLKWIFNFNKWWLNVLWALVMVVISSLTIGKRTKMQRPVFLIPFFISVLFSIIIIDGYFLGIVLKLPYFFDAHYFVPITGMILGNFLKSNVIALNSFYSSLKKEIVLYRFILGNGGTRQEALTPFIRDALKMAFNPIIANTAVTGLIALPGMMTGQILGGSTPTVAIKYQIMLVIIIFVGSLLSVFFTLQIINGFIFDGYDRLKTNLFVKKTNKPQKNYRKKIG